MSKISYVISHEILDSKLSYEISYVISHEISYGNFTWSFEIHSVRQYLVNVVLFGINNL